MLSLTPVPTSRETLRYFRCHTGLTEVWTMCQIPPQKGRLQCLHFFLALAVLPVSIFRAATFWAECGISQKFLWDPQRLSRLKLPDKQSGLVYLLLAHLTHTGETGFCLKPRNHCYIFVYLAHRLVSHQISFCSEERESDIHLLLLTEVVKWCFWCLHRERSCAFFSHNQSRVLREVSCLEQNRRKMKTGSFWNWD